MTGWLFRRFVMRRWLRNPIRPLLMLIAVLLATTLWSAVLRTTFSGIRSFEESLGISTGDQRIILSAHGGRLLSAELSACLSGLTPGFEITALRTESARLVTPQRSLPVRVIGVGGYGDAMLATTGGDLDQHTIVVSAQVAESVGLRRDQDVSLELADALLVGRALPPDTQRREPLGDSVVVSLSALAAVAPSGAVDTVLFKPRIAGDINAFSQELSRWFQGCYRGGAPLRVESAQSRVERGEQLLAAYRFNVLVMAVMTLVVCILLVAQAAHASLITFSRELSILRTLGIGNVECLLIVVVEAGFIGIFGALLGISLGYPVTLTIVGFLSGTASEIYKLSMQELDGIRLLLSELGVVCTIVLVAVLGALMGGIQALRIAPNLGTRRDFVHMRPLMPATTQLLAVLSAVLFVLTLVMAQVVPALWSSYLFALTCVVAVIGCTPLAVLCAPRLDRFSPTSLVARLAAGGVRMSGKAYVRAAMGVAVASTLMVALALMVDSFRATLQSWMDSRMQGDLFISSRIEGQGNEGRLSPLFVREVSALVGIELAVPYYETSTFVGDRAVVVAATDLSTQLRKGVYRFVEGTFDVGSEEGGTGCAISESAARKLSLGVGDTLTLEKRWVCSVRAVLQEFGTEQPMVLINDHAFLSLYPGQAPQSLIVYAQKRADILAVRAAIEQRGRGGVVVRDQTELKELVIYLFDRTFRVTSSVRWIVFGLGVLGLVVSGLQVLWERRREVKTLHVLGASQLQIVTSSVLEIGLVSVGPLVLGVVMGSVMGWALTAFINPRSFGWTLEFSLSDAPLVVAVAFVLCVLLSFGLVALLAVRQVLIKTTLADE